MDGVQNCREIMDTLNRVIMGKEEVIEKVMTAIIAGGHILIEDVPGVGKTMMAKTFGAAMSLENKRIQFTTDVMPSDITGYTMFDKRTNDFVYKPGAVSCNLLLADEINRTSSKTQAALLEVMEEGKVTVDGITRELPQPFIVIATQNPMGSIGTSMLPESQLDRFMFRLHMGYPKPEQEIAMIENKTWERELLQNIGAVVTREELLAMQAEADEVYVHRDIITYIVQLVELTRKDKNIALGVSPRGTIAIVRAAKAYAYVQGRDYVLPDDVREIFYPAVNHRIILSGQGKTQGIKIKPLIEDILSQVKVEKSRK